ncbi:MAG TPA: sugar transferase [Eubacteriaceae bacterium]|nr:sugar transferase [Eubacteriaceae bacterium]
MKNIFKYEKLNKWLIIIMDIVLIMLGFYGAFMLRYGFNPPIRNYQPYINLIPWIILFSFIYINIYDLSEIIKKRIYDMGISVFLSLMMLQITTIVLTFIFRGFAFPRSVFIISFILQFILLMTWKTLMIKFARKAIGMIDVMIIGDEQESEAIAKKLLIDHKESWHIKYMINDEELHLINDIIDDVDMLVACPKLEKYKKSKLVNLALKNNKKIYIIPELYEIMLVKSQLITFDDMPGLEIEQLQLSVEDKFIKRIFDIIVSSILIILSLPLMIISAILVKLTSKGPALYSQERLTMNNKPFKLYKFRTMVNNAERKTGPVLAADNDSRITKVGNLLRMTRLDELPQLFNVLKGDMSIVGPRPEREFFVSQFIKDNKEFGYRTSVKAGITGLAQIYGKYTTSFEDKLRYDLIYIGNYSFGLDIVIILKTIKTMLTKASSKGLKEDKTLNELLKEQDKIIISEIGAANIEE